MPVVKKTYWLIFLIGFISGKACSQHFTEVKFNEHTINTKSREDSVYLIATKYPTTGITLHFNATDNPEGSCIIVGQDTLWFYPDRENINDEPVTYSNLYTFPAPVDTFLFCPGNLKQSVRFIYIDGRLPEEKEPLPSKKKSADCSEPEMIDQSVWREGLADPDYERIPNIVHNVIIHHSAGSNTDTNYIQMVRNIYIYHTEVREWSDIGYNYLIAQEGTVFKGRDPDELEQDNVLGAHFCASNTGTMGICVLGNYMEVVPPENAVLSLINLVTWKLAKDSLDPLRTYPHPLNPELHVIAGHRDGCATDCPGDWLYSIFPELRQLVADELTNCGFDIKPLSIQNEPTEDFHFTLSNEELRIYSSNAVFKQIALFDLSGRVILLKSFPDHSNEITLPVPHLKPGIYMLRVDGNNGSQSFKILIH